MKKLLIYLASLVFLAATPMLHAAPDYTMPDQQQLQTYYAKLQEQVTKAQDHLNDILKEMSDPSIMSPSLRLQLDSAAQMASVKMTLANNFIGTPSMRSQAVRDRLLQVLSQDVINESDLLSLQSLVDSEKAKIAAFDRQQQAKAKAQQDAQQKSQQQQGAAIK